jgi:hypothetical protein
MELLSPIQYPLISFADELSEATGVLYYHPKDLPFYEENLKKFQSFRSPLMKACLPILIIRIYATKIRFIRFFIFCCFLCAKVLCCFSFPHFSPSFWREES